VIERARIHRPSHAEVARFTRAQLILDEADKFGCAPPLGLFHHGVAAVGGLGTAPFPSISDELHRWDMEDSTVTTSSGDVTGVSDLVGSDDLVTETVEPSNAPADVASDPDLGGRRACQLVKSNDEAQETGAISAVSAPYTMWLIFTFDDTAGGPLLATGAPDYVVGYGYPSLGRWEFETSAYGLAQGNVTNPSANTSYFVAFVCDDTSSEVYVNDVAQNITLPTYTKHFYTADLERFVIGYTDYLGTHTSLSWTAAGITDSAMGPTDRAAIEAWRAANAA